MKNDTKTRWSFGLSAGRGANGSVFREVAGANGLRGKLMDREVYEEASRRAAQSLRRSAAARTK